MSQMRWYFAYGSMSNPISLKRRGLVPPESHPAVLEGFELSFMPANGFANIHPCPEGHLHGVVHLITDEELQRLETIEIGYEVQRHRVAPYGPEAPAPMEADVFINQDEEPRDPPVLPQRRYLRIIEEGLRHFGVDEAWIERACDRCSQPTRAPEDYLRAPQAEDPDALPVWDARELRAQAGEGPYRMALGERVVEVEVHEQLHPIYHDIFGQMLSGDEVTLKMCMAIYEPDLPSVDGPDDITPAHQAWAENMVMEMARQAGADVRHIARFEPCPEETP